MSALFWFAAGAAFAWFVIPEPPSFVVAGKNWVWSKISELISKS